MRSLRSRISAGGASFSFFKTSNYNTDTVIRGRTTRPTTVAVRTNAS